MTPVLCSGPDCDRPAIRKGMCIFHRRQFLRGEELRPLLRKRCQNIGKECSFPGCQKPAKSLLLCIAHYDQHRNGLDLFALYDRQRLSEKRKAYWNSMTPDARQKRLRGMRETTYERTEEWALRKSAEVRASWAEGRHPSFKPKVCRGCNLTFKPNSGSQKFCTKECYLLANRAEKYGMTNNELEALIKKQDGVCALCRRPEAGFWRGQPLVVDHCHTTGKVRGLLCGDCNTAIGRFGDDPVRLRAAADYIERASC